MPCREGELARSSSTDWAQKNERRTVSANAVQWIRDLIRICLPPRSFLPPSSHQEAIPREKSKEKWHSGVSLPLSMNIAVDRLGRSVRTTLCWLVDAKIPFLVAPAAAVKHYWVTQFRICLFIRSITGLRATTFARLVVVWPCQSVIQQVVPTARSDRGDRKSPTAWNICYTGGSRKLP